MKKVLAMIMAGGKGERLMPLTEHRSKPAIPFGGVYQLIDLTLSQLHQFRSVQNPGPAPVQGQTLIQHLEEGWVHIFSPALGHYLKIVPPQMMAGEKWYQGTADSIRQNAYLVAQESRTIS